MLVIFMLNIYRYTFRQNFKYVPCIELDLSSLPQVFTVKFSFVFRIVFQGNLYFIDILGRYRRNEQYKLLHKAI